MHQTNQRFIRCAEPRCARLRTARAKKVMLLSVPALPAAPLPRTSRHHQRIPRDSPEEAPTEPHRCSLEPPRRPALEKLLQSGLEMLQRCTKRIPQRGPRRTPEEPPEDLSRGPQRGHIWGPFWAPSCIKNLWFFIGFTTKVETCAIMEREARNVQERQYAGNRKE